MTKVSPLLVSSGYSLCVCMCGVCGVCMYILCEACVCERVVKAV